MAERTLYLIVCGAPAAAEIDSFVKLAQDAGWLVRVIATPMGFRFLDVDRITELTGAPIRTTFREPHETSNGLPPADAVLVAPATFNTVNKWALGITDNVAVGMLCELAGSGLPILAVPQLSPELAGHVAFAAHLDALRSMGVRILFEPVMPRWEDVLKELNSPA
jgi:phosphopantothenoylcysteine synthetase/decarboxylase